MSNFHKSLVLAVIITLACFIVFQTAIKSDDLVSQTQSQQVNTQETNRGAMGDIVVSTETQPECDTTEVFRRHGYCSIRFTFITTTENQKGDGS